MTTAAVFCCGRRVVKGHMGGKTVVLDWPGGHPYGTVQAHQTAAGGWVVQSAPPGEPIVPPFKRYQLHQCQGPPVSP